MKSFSYQHFVIEIKIVSIDPKTLKIDSKSPEKPTAKQESAIGALATANQNIIDLIARRYSSPSDTLKNAMANSTAIANARKSASNEAALPTVPAPEKPVEPSTPTTPSSPSAMLNKFTPGNIFKNFFK
jgi:hypothetical protein